MVKEGKKRVEESLGYKLNKEWIEEKKRQGYTIVDIGEDPKRSYRSPYYKMEKEVVENYVSKTEIKVGEE